MESGRIGFHAIGSIPINVLISVPNNRHLYNQSAAHITDMHEVPKACTPTEIIMELRLLTNIFFQFGLVIHFDIFVDDKWFGDITCTVVVVDVAFQIHNSPEFQKWSLS